MSQLYRPLPNGCIRVLALYPRQGEGMISCSLRTHSLWDEASTLPFVALSYVWGLDTPSFKILIDKQEVLIRENLYNFLLQVVPHDGLWIDALCINQQDDNERSQQVSIMGEVYSQVQMVLAWLGPVQDLALRDALSDLCKNTSRYIYNVEDRHREAEDRPSWSELSALSRCTYWSRAWVVQEFLLAKSVSLVYGDVQLDSAILSRLISSQEMNGKVLARMHLDEIRMWNWHRYGHNRQHKPWRRYGGVEPSSIPSENSLMESLITQRELYGLSFGRKQDMMELLRYNYKRDCREPRDKVYCLLSLVHDSRSASQKLGIDVDYKAPISAVFYSVMKAALVDDDMIFTYGTGLRRLLGITELPIPPPICKNPGVTYVDVAGYIDAEVVQVIELNNEDLERERDSESWRTKAQVSFLEKLRQPYMTLLSNTTSKEVWSEDWVRNESLLSSEWTREQPTLASTSNYHLDLHIPSCRNASIPSLIPELEKLPMDHLLWASGLSKALNERVAPLGELSVTSPTADPSNFALVVLKFRTNTGASHGHNVDTHDFRADYLLGLAHGAVSSGDQVLSLSNSLPDFGLSLSDEPSTHLTGSICWIHNAENTRYGKRHRAISPHKFPGKPVGPQSEFLYRKVRLKMTAEEILQMTQA